MHPWMEGIEAGGPALFSQAGLRPKEGAPDTASAVGTAQLAEERPSMPNAQFSTRPVGGRSQRGQRGQRGQQGRSEGFALQRDPQFMRVWPRISPLPTYLGLLFLP